MKLLTPHKSFLFTIAFIITVAFSSPSHAATPPRLLSTWGSFINFGIHIANIDAKTGTYNGQLLSSTEYAQVFPGNPALDRKGQRAYIALIGAVAQNITTFLVGFDVSSNSAEIILRTPLPEPEILLTIFDPQTERVYVASKPLVTVNPSATMGYVDLATGSYVNVTTFPKGIIPVGLGIGMTSATFNPKTRSIIMFCATAPQKFAITSYNLETKQFTSVPFNSWRINNLVYDTVTDKIFALLSAAGGGKVSNTTTAVTLNPTTGKVNIVNTWNSNLVATLGAGATFDASNNVMYCVMGTSAGSSISLVSVSTQTGALLNAALLRGELPQSLFFI